jgi:hypothetical protein
LGGRTALKAFRNVRGNRKRCSADLIAQVTLAAECSSLRKRFDSFSQVHTRLPHRKIFEPLIFHCIALAAATGRASYGYDGSVEHDCPSYMLNLQSEII